MKDRVGEWMLRHIWCLPYAAFTYSVGGLALALMYDRAQLGYAVNMWLSGACFSVGVIVTALVRRKQQPTTLSPEERTQLEAQLRGITEDVFREVSTRYPDVEYSLSPDEDGDVSVH